VYHKFPYREEGTPPVLRPTIDVRLSFGPNGEWTTKALVDTGAPITLFDRGVADALGIRWDHAGCETGITAILGGSRHIQFELVDICLANDESLSWSARVAFIKDPAFQMPFQGILGADGFLDRWMVTFNKYYDYFELRNPDADWP
jgi:hypothetical protein